MILVLWDSYVWMKDPPATSQLYDDQELEPKMNN